ncbi:hypothetical protein [Thiomicrospira microaerophila]|uniref:hypothetical protein n=1 Tax=Thiomicrospira microaerophila TaxID=406020 RepID=UPI0005C8A1EE|nr:hypothetical protein [Thiomicrospira microaerophila]
MKRLLGLASAALLLGSGVSHAASVSVVSGYYHPSSVQYVVVESHYAPRVRAPEVVYVVETRPARTYTLREYEVVGYAGRSCHRCDTPRVVYSAPTQCR